MTVEIKGLRELSAALEGLGKSLERGVLRRTAVKALEPVRDRAQQLAPVDEGHLRDSIVIGNRLTRSAKAADKAEPRQGVRVYCGTANRNAVPREFGTVRSAADPFMRPAWDSESGGMLDTIGRVLGPDIERTAARLAKKQGKL